ncbi:unnamed protein product [Caenorhabditis angaria]|uniref:G-protein coupled receptors family 1 profile domain-containing protein n=1 Tax=Caenorhabditis angaria TaxID=860376 RepID=A0A9P1NCL0_9PELO|nr:unnamed protein product [Caenorhabditis angaria]
MESQFDKLNMTVEERDEIWRFYNETVRFERKIGIIIPSIFALIILIGVIGNVLVVVVAFGRQMRNSTNTLIIGLAISDLCFLLLCVPFTAVDYAAPKWLFPEWTCSMINFFQHTSAYCSVWTLTLMAVDRYMAVVYPVESITLRTPKNTMIALIVVYAIIIASQIPVGNMHGIYTYLFIWEERSACAILSIATGEASKTVALSYFFTFNIFGYVLPLGISIFLYWRMLRRLWDTPRPGNVQPTISPRRSGGEFNSSGSIRNRPEARRAKKKVTRLVLCVLITWALCWLPLNICFFISGIVYPDTLVIAYGVIMVIFQISSQVLAYTNSCLNPILYAMMSKSFREGFIRVIRKLMNFLSCGFCFTDEMKTSTGIDATFYNQVPVSSIKTERTSLLKESSNRSSVQNTATSKTKHVGRSKSSRSFNL